jgi:hypothetical protein
MAECKGRCDGDIEPPKAKAECEASAKADASVNVECTPPRVAISYKLKGSLDAQASAKFTAAVKNLEVRLPALLASIKKAGKVSAAGKGLIDAGADVTASVKAQIDAKPELKVAIGLGCAVTQLGDVGKAIETSSSKLAASIKASGELTTALGV